MSKRSNDPRKCWTDEDIAILTSRYPDAPTIEIAKLLGRKVHHIYAKAKKLGVCKSEAFLSSPASGRLRDGSVGLSGRFPKGHVPANKGSRRPGWGPGRMKTTQFKRGTLNGNAAHLYRPIGTVLADPEGYLRIKVAERVNGKPAGWHKDIWPLVHHRNWEAVHGPIPAGHIVIFKDRNRSNPEVENLELITVAENMRRNTVHNLPPDLKQVVMLNGQLKKVIRNRQRKNDGKELNAGSPQSSVRNARSA
jgi:hypothetical protein